MNIYQHFRPEEREFIDQALQWKNYVESTYALKLTDFLDPREQHILKMLIGDHGEVKYKFFGGSPGVERKRACLMPEYLNEDEVDFQIRLCEINYPMKFVTIEHPQVLGTLMSLGLKRGKFGDILIKEGRIQFFTAAEVSEYIKNNLVSIGRASVKLRELDLVAAISSEELWMENVITVSSLRLDTVVAGMHNLSRQKSQMFIGQGVVKVNWSIIENTSFECAEGDLISVRGQGRAKIMSIEGKTKKEKWRIQVGKQK
jgi:RNA-binding protein YlmH